jgi:eukaryotic-like serine/threonine-protein kinase
MTPQQYERLAELFHAAQEIAPHDREVFLDHVSKSDPDLRKDLESLLANAAVAFTENPPGDVAAGYLVHQGTNTANIPSLTPGTRFDHYEIHSLLGKGGMGEVYLAEDVRLHRKVALKILPLVVAANQNRMQCFEQEAQAAAALNHPNVAHIYEIGESDGIHFISIEYIDGDNLRNKIYRDNASLEELLKYVTQVAEGLSKAHAAGVVHRDLKPDNIMITRDDYAKILDFGLAKLIEPRQPLDKTLSGEVDTEIMAGHSLAGMVMGTIGYMSPEQAQGKATEIDQRSDIFSFGCILFEMVTKQKPFADESFIKSLHKVINKPAPSINDINPSAPTELQHIVRRCLAKDPDERYQTIKDVELELKAVRQQMARASETDTATHPPRRTSSAGFISRHKKIAAISVVVIVFGYGLYRLGNQRGISTQTPANNLKRLTATGKVPAGSISPDGTQLVYVVADGGRQSIWVRQILTSNQVQIVPPAEVTYINLSFTHDGNYIYFNKREKDGPDSLYQMPVSGGVARKMIENFATRVALSPDDRRIAFIRGVFFENENSLVVANNDGSEEQVLVTHKAPLNFYSGGITWTPDGKSITCVSGPHAQKLIQVPLDGGPEKLLKTPKWFSIIDVEWLRDNSGLIVAAREPSRTSPVQIWHLSYPGGEARKITNDFNNYPFLSLSAEGNALIVIRRESVSHIWLAPDGDASRAQQLTTGTSRQDGNPSVHWTPDSRIIYDSTAGGNIHTWIMNVDGSDQRQLNDGPYDDQGAHVSPDGRYIVFTSNRSDTQHIYRMDIDGNNLKQLTNGTDEVAPFFTPDGKWVICSSNKSASWKVPVNGGELVPLTNDSWASDISADGRLVAYVKPSKAGSLWNIVIMPFAGGPPLRTFDVTSDSRPNPRWTPDGRAIIYNLTHGGVLSGVTNLWTQPLDGGPAKQLTDFKSETFFSFDLSPDGKSLISGRGTISSDIVLISSFR